ncbi:MAG: hypothetical protein ACYDBJ_29500 [Aggregatilineales bacterium]
MAVLAYLAAVHLLIIYWRRPRWWLLIGMWIPLLLCLGTYETAYPLVVFTPLILVWLQRGTSRRILRVAALWYLVPLIMAPLVVNALLTGGTIESAIVNSDTGTLAERLSGYLTYFVRPYYRDFIGGWIDVIHQLQDGAIDFVTPAIFLGHV